MSCHGCHVMYMGLKVHRTGPDDPAMSIETPPVIFIAWGAEYEYALPEGHLEQTQSLNFKSRRIFELLKFRFALLRNNACRTWPDGRMVQKTLPRLQPMHI